MPRQKLRDLGGRLSLLHGQVWQEKAFTSLLMPRISAPSRNLQWTRSDDAKDTLTLTKLYHLMQSTGKMYTGCSTEWLLRTCLMFCFCCPWAQSLCSPLLSFHCLISMLPAFFWHASRSQTNIKLMSIVLHLQLSYSCAETALYSVSSGSTIIQYRIEGVACTLKTGMLKQPLKTARESSLILDLMPTHSQR